MWRFLFVFSFDYSTVLYTFSLPTELIILVLSYLPAIKLFAFQRTYHKIRYIVAEIAYFSTSSMPRSMASKTSYLPSPIFRTPRALVTKSRKADT